MNEKVRIEVDEVTATLLEARAEDAQRLAHFRSTGEGVPWFEVKAWMQSWGSEHELPSPKPRTLD